MLLKGGTNLSDHALWFVVALSLQAVYDPHGNFEPWLLGCEVDCNALHQNHIIQPLTSVLNSMTMNEAQCDDRSMWLDVFAAAWTAAHRRSVVCAGICWAGENPGNTLTWALWLCIGPVLLLNAALAQAGPVSFDMTSKMQATKRRMDKMAQIERQALTKRDVDCKHIHRQAMRVPKRQRVSKPASLTAQHGSWGHRSYR